MVVDGVSYQHTVVTGGRTSASVYSSLLSTVGSNGVSLANSLQYKGVTWPSSLTSNVASLTSSVGSENAFTLTAATTNTGGLGTATYTLDWADAITVSPSSAFTTSSQITVTILGVAYQSGTSSSTTTEARFDAAGAALQTILTNAGYPTTFSSTNKLIRDHHRECGCPHHRKRFWRGWRSGCCELFCWHIHSSEHSTQPNRSVEQHCG